MSLGPFVKLFTSIVDSTIWREAPETKVVWITMLVKADKHGAVYASVPGLADASRVSIEACRLALARLMEPDPDSRTQAYEGRRIQPLDDGGGWLVLNYAEKRKLMDAEREREQARERARRHYDKHKRKHPREAPPAELVLTPVPPPPAGNWITEACETWHRETDGVYPAGQMGAELKPLLAAIAKKRSVTIYEAWKVAEPHFREYAASPDARKFGVAHFAKNPRRVRDAKKGKAGQLDGIKEWLATREQGGAT